MTSTDLAQKSKSRRDRPAKAPLSRQGIIDAALAILRQEGLDRVTMRRIAVALDTGPSSLYVYVRDTHDLHAQLLDALLGSLPAPTGGPWQARLRDLLTGYRDLLFRYPEIAHMTTVTHPSGPNYLSLVDSVLALLQEGGVPDRDAAWAVDVLLLFATSVAAEQSARHASAQASTQASAEDTDLNAAIVSADASVYPQIARVGKELLSGGPERFQWVLDVLFSGVLNTPRPDVKETP